MLIWGSAAHGLSSIRAVGTYNATWICHSGEYASNASIVVNFVSPTRIAAATIVAGSYTAKLLDLDFRAASKYISCILQLIHSVSFVIKTIILGKQL